MSFGYVTAVNEIFEEEVVTVGFSTETMEDDDLLTEALLKDELEKASEDVSALLLISLEFCESCTDDNMELFEIISLTILSIS